MWWMTLGCSWCKIVLHSTACMALRLVGYCWSVVRLQFTRYFQLVSCLGDRSRLHPSNPVTISTKDLFVARLRSRTLMEMSVNLRDELCPTTSPSHFSHSGFVQSYCTRPLLFDSFCLFHIQSLPQKRCVMHYVGRLCGGGKVHKWPIAYKVFGPPHGSLLVFWHSAEFAFVSSSYSEAHFSQICASLVCWSWISASGCSPCSLILQCAKLETAAVPSVKLMAYVSARWWQKSSQSVVVANRGGASRWHWLDCIEVSLFQEKSSIGQLPSLGQVRSHGQCDDFQKREKHNMFLFYE